MQQPQRILVHVPYSTYSKLIIRLTKEAQLNVFPLVLIEFLIELFKIISANLHSTAAYKCSLAGTQVMSFLHVRSDASLQVATIAVKLDLNVRNRDTVFFYMPQRQSDSCLSIVSYNTAPLPWS